MVSHKLLQLYKQYPSFVIGCIIIIMEPDTINI